MLHVRARTLLGSGRQKIANAQSFRFVLTLRQTSSIPASSKSVAVDSDGIPLVPPYSVRSFLSSLPTPELSDHHFIHLYTLAALTPPAKGTKEFDNKKKQLMEMIRLVEGVREDATAEQHASQDEIPDARIWPENQGMDLDWERDIRTVMEETRHEKQPTLLGLAQKKHLAGYYSVHRHQRGEVE